MKFIQKSWKVANRIRVDYAIYSLALASLLWVYFTLTWSQTGSF